MSNEQIEQAKQHSEAAQEHNRKAAIAGQTGKAFLGLGCGLIGIGIGLILLLVGGLILFTVGSAMFSNDGGKPKVAAIKATSKTRPKAIPQSSERDEVRVTSEQTIWVGDFPINDLGNIVCGLYEGKLSEDFATKCLVMPDAHAGELVNLEQNVALCRVRGGNLNQLLEFVITGVAGNDDPLYSVPLRFVGRKDFNTVSGLVKSVPVFRVTANKAKPSDAVRSKP